MHGIVFRIHEQTTGQEIREAFEDANLKLDHLVIPYGTGGTLVGVSRVMRKWSPNTQIHVCEPTNAPMLISGINTEYAKSGQPATSFNSESFLSVN